MKRSLPAILLFCSQLYLILKGVNAFNKFSVPFLLFIVSALLLVIYFQAILSTGKQNTLLVGRKSQSGKMPGIALAVLYLCILFWQVKQAISLVADPSTGSDVIPQLISQYDRFSGGLQPYYPLEQYPWHPFPVYMPLHWLPVGLAYLLKTDVRWIGFFFFSLSYLCFSYLSWNGQHLYKSILAISFPVIVFYSFVHWAQKDMAVTFEFIIAAYYLLLVSGLMFRNLALIVLGITSCVLSRYTLLFWLPLFAITLWSSSPKIKSFLVWGIIIVSVLIFYIIPFYSKDPTILTNGLKYHNECYINDWNGFGHPEQTTAFDQGLNFSYFICNSLKGDMHFRVFIARSVQGGLMLVLLFAGWLLFRKWKDKTDNHLFDLGMLYSFIYLFYFFSPITYRYYYIAPMMISAGLCAIILLSGKEAYREHV